MSDTHNAASIRISSLLDANSFVPIGAGVKARSTDFCLSENAAPSDGVITGFGTIDGSPVYVYSQDAAVLGGTIGEMHAKKIVRLYDMAAKTGSPVIGILDSNGVRLEESTDALDALGSIYAAMSAASGVIPQIAIVAGNCGGALSFIPALSDLVLMTDKAKLFVNSPDAIEGSNVDVLDNRTAAFQAKAGNVDFAGTEEEVLQAARTLVGFLPANNEDDGEIIACTDDLNRATPNLSTLNDDAAKILEQIADNGIFFETKKDHAPNMVTGFMRLDGQTIGAVANRGAKDSICAGAARKAASFINLCDSFNIPIFMIANASAYGRCEHCEKMLPFMASKMIYAYTNATVPKVTLVTGKAFGGAYIMMGSKALGADVVYAWPGASIGAMDAKQAAKIVAQGADERAAAKKFAELQNNVASAAARGYVDTVIEEADTRKYVIGAFEMLYTKKENRPLKKHGTI